MDLVAFGWIWLIWLYLIGSGWILLDSVWVWFDLVGSGWFWFAFGLLLVGFGWIWLDFVDSGLIWGDLFGFA